MWHQGSSLWHGAWGVEDGLQANFATSSWLVLLQRCIPCLFLCLMTAMFPVRQEVDSASCHSPLSCGHFLMFCQCLSLLLTQRTEVVLLAVGSGRTESSLLMVSDLQWHNNVRLLLVFTTFIMITLITSKPNIVDRLHSDVVSFWGQSLLFFLTLCTFISIFWCNFAGGGNQTKSFCFWDEIMLLSYFYTKQDRTALNCLHSEFRSVNLWVL